MIGYLGKFEINQCVRIAQSLFNQCTVTDVRCYYPFVWEIGSLFFTQVIARKGMIYYRAQPTGRTSKYFSFLKFD
jgi:hypothetical protein